MPAPAHSLPKPLLVHSMATSVWAWRLHRRIYVFPCSIISHDVDLVIEDAVGRHRLDLLMYAPEIGLGLAWCRDEIQQEIAPMAPAGIELGSWMHPSYPPVGMWSLVQDSQSANPCWTCTDQGEMVAFYPNSLSHGQGVRLSDWLTPGLFQSWDQEAMANIWMCMPCGILEATTDRTRICPACSRKMEAGIADLPRSTPTVRTLEDVIHRMGVDPVLCRVGPMAWILRLGSTEMVLRYAPEEASLCVDVHLVRIGPETDRKGLYEYLLYENVRLDSYGFSIQDDLVMISMVLPDRAIQEVETAVLLSDLLKKSDDYDNHLVSVFRALWL